MDYLNTNVSASGPLFCIVDLTNSPSSAEQEFVNNYINTKREMMGRVIFGSGQLEVATTISDNIEENLADIFGLISECLLSVGIKSPLRKREGVKIENFYLNGCFHADMAAYMREYKQAPVEGITEKTKNAEEINKGLLDPTQLSRLFKCSVFVDYFVRKYSITAETVNKIFEENDYETMITDRIYSEIQTARISMDWDRCKHKTNDCWLCKKLGSMIKNMADTISIFEDACEQTRKTLSVMKKMLFEVDNYLHQFPFGNDMNPKEQPLVVPQTLRKKLLG